MKYREEKIISYCSYCHSPIFEDEDYTKENGYYYHKFCYKQMNTYYDPLENYEE